MLRSRRTRQEGGLRCAEHEVKCEASCQGPGVAADVFMLVTVHESEDCDGSTMAYASACHTDQNGRPVAAYINFCPSKVAHASATHRVRAD